MTLRESLKELLSKEAARNQEELCHLLTEQGFVVNQTKISRLLHQLGAIKLLNEEGELVYTLPKEPLPPPAESPIGRLVQKIAHNETLIVINTSPGAAQLIARFLDYHKEKIFILGTVAGDDTIFVAPVSTSSIEMVMESLKKMLAEDV